VRGGLGSRKDGNCKDERSVVRREVSTCGQVVQENMVGHTQRISSAREEAKRSWCCLASPTNSFSFPQLRDLGISTVTCRSLPSSRREAWCHGVYRCVTGCLPRARRCVTAVTLGEIAPSHTLTHTDELLSPRNLNHFVIHSLFMHFCWLSIVTEELRYSSIRTAKKRSRHTPSSSSPPHPLL
jgi:hypothetical protein